MARSISNRTNRAKLTAVLLAALCIASVVSGCRQDMHDQPKYVPLRPVDQLGSITDGRSARPLVEGTVPHGDLREDVEFYTGKLAGFENTASSAPGQAQTQMQTGQQGSAATQMFRGYVTEFPMQIGAQDLNAGQE